MDAEVAHATFEEKRAHGIGHGADPDLQARAVLNLRCNKPGHGAVSLRRSRVRKLGQRLTGPVDNEVDHASVQSVVDPAPAMPALRV